MFIGCSPRVKITELVDYCVWCMGLKLKLPWRPNEDLTRGPHYDANATLAVTEPC